MSLLAENRILAAPLAGISNSVYRRWARKFGAGMVFTEMASAEGIRRNDSRTLDLLRFDELERPIFAQIFDDDHIAIRDAAKIIEELGFDGVDLNFGCPAKKVVNKGAGSAILRDMPRALDIVEAALKVVNIPVSVKMRSGWNEGDETAIEMIENINSMGVAFVTLHPRSREKFFKGKSDWSLIAKAVKTAEMPVVGNGDIESGADAVEMIEKTGCSAVMIGRASMGNPWIFDEVSAAIEGREMPEPPSNFEIIEVCRKYIRELIEYHGERNGTNLAKKQIVWFTSGMPNCKRLRTEVFSAKRKEQIFSAIDGFSKDLVEIENINIDETKAVKCR